VKADGFSIVFVTQESRFSEKGYIYSRPISLFEPRRFLVQLKRRNSYIAGGYCFILNKQIWNASRAALYDPREVYCDVDTLDYALTFLQSVVECLPSEKKVQCSLLEMVIFKSRYKDDRVLSLVGEAVNGSVVYRQITVEASSFFDALSNATNEYIRFAKSVSESIDESMLLASRTKRILQSKLKLPEWVAAAEQLARIVSDTTSS
jgi:hypothetical protein